MKLIFQAEDGILFDTAEECMEYEGTCRKRWHDMAEFDYWDKSGARIDFDKDDEEEFCAAIDEAYFVRLPRNLSESEIMYLVNEIGTDLPRTKGLWRFDYDLQDWRNYDEEYATFQKNWPKTVRSALFS